MSAEAGYVALSLGDVAAAGALIAVNAAVSIAFHLGLERSLTLAVLRMVAQLGLIGLVLEFVFEGNHPGVTALVACVMVAVAGYEAMARQTNRITGPYPALLGSTTLLVVGLVATVYLTRVVIGVSSWTTPRVFLPLLGMILGNSLTGVALALETLTQTAKAERGAIEARLALGHSRFQAFDGALKRALTTAMMPIINSMAIAGIVSLPGMMTGQILSGVPPMEAAKYQVMIMFAISGATGLAVVAAATGGVLLLSDERSRLRLDRLAASQ